MATHGLSADAAHRLIARAIELDARRGEEVSIERLRRLFRRDAEVAPTGSIIDRIGMNVIAFGAFMALATLLMRSSYSMGTKWVGQAGAMLVANLVGLAIARRLNARVTTFVLSVTAISQAAEFVLHLVYGIKSVQSGPTHMAVILASLIGVAVGAVASRRKTLDVAANVEVAQPVESTKPSVAERVIATLRLSPG